MLLGSPGGRGGGGGAGLVTAVVAAAFAGCEPLAEAPSVFTAEAAPLHRGVNRNVEAFTAVGKAAVKVAVEPGSSEPAATIAS